MRKEQLWLQFPNNSLEKSAYRGSHYHPTGKGTSGQAGRRVHVDKAQKLPNFSIIFAEEAEEFWFQAKRLLPAAGESPGHSWTSTAVLCLSMHPENIPFQCNSMPSWISGTHTEGQGNRLWVCLSICLTLKSHGVLKPWHMGTCKKRKAEDFTFELIQWVSMRQHHVQGKDSALLAAGHSPCTTKLVRVPATEGLLSNKREHKAAHTRVAEIRSPHQINAWLMAPNRRLQKHSWTSA